MGHNTNNTDDYGLFQVNSIHSALVAGNLQSLLDPETNVRVAAQIKASSGWHAWVTYNTGKYLQFIK